MKAQRQKFSAFYQSGLKFLILLLLCSGSGRLSYAQCPPNIDFELRDFTGWECWVGSVAAVAGTNVITWSPNLPVNPTLYPARFQMLSAIPGNGLDTYGQFPRNCPNGSGHSIQLGNSSTGAEAEGVSYTFTIPAGQNRFSLIYHYAVIFQDPSHSPWEQPRLQIEIKNITDGTTIGCSSFTFISTSGLPGFFTSPVDPSVQCKNWSANSINLDGNAGKTIQLFFKTADCTRNGHFGYAYLDVNTECSSDFIGATYCPDDTAINVTAPYGYETYTWWFAADPTVIIGTSQTINFTPPPPPGTILQVAVTPYAGYGCPDTLTAILQDTLTILSDAGPDRLSCNLTPVQLGVNPKVGYVYSWSPVTGLSNPNISNPVTTVSTTTQYVVTTSHDGGGCITTDTVIVSAAVLDSSIQVTGPSQFCFGQQTAVLQVNAADSIQWYLNGIAIPGANQTTYNVTQSGTYHATVFSFVGCSSNTATRVIVVDPSPLAGFNINSNNQCFSGNQFVFTNTSTITSGVLQYNWDLGDGTTAITTDVNHSYAIEGTYTVKLLVTSDKGCRDSISFTVTVYPSATAGFTVDDTGQCFKGNQFVFSNTSTVSSGALLYNWDMGDGNFVTTRDVTYSYSQPGTYTVKLLATAGFGCADSLSFDVTVYPEPVAGFTVNNAQQCHGGNQFILTNTTSILSGTLQFDWNLGDGSTATSTDVNHSYNLPGDYTIKMLAVSDNGCRDSSSTDVKVFAYPFADYLVREPACINQPVLLINETLNNSTSTVNYVWDFGNGAGSTLKNPVYSFPAPGNYAVKLSVSTDQCPLTVSTKVLNVLIEAPAPGVVYPDKTAIFNFPEQLQARQIGATALWTPATSLSNRFSYSPVFKGLSPQLYTIELKTLSGCLTVDTQLVKTKKKIEIYVPTAFTPGGNGINDYLRPTLMGFIKVNYFRIYNRWGRMLFQMQSDRPGWDGKVNGQPAELQTVVWMIEAVDVDGEVHRRQGTTVLIR